MSACPPVPRQTVPPWRVCARRSGFRLRLALLLVVLPAAVGGGAAHAAEWIAAWAAAPQDLSMVPVVPGALAPQDERTPVPVDRSFRQRLHPTLDGRRVRLRFSNRFGREAVVIRAASLGRAQPSSGAGPAGVSSRALQALRFAGRPELRLPPGGEAWSDPVLLPVKAGEPLAVGYAVSGGSWLPTVHRLPYEPGHAIDGEAVMQPAWPAARPTPWNGVVIALDVERERPLPVLVAFGDSLTSGVGQETDPAQPPRRYPDLLAERLRAHAPNAPMAVINAGIAGNRLLTERIGPRGTDRFAQDVLAQSGVTHVLVLIGINDIGFDGPRPVRASIAQAASEPLVEGLRTVIAAAHARGVKVWLATLLPFEGAAYWSPLQERRRQALNAWIRAQHEADGVVDLDAALRDPAQPTRLAAAFDSGDHLHPNANGNAAMAQAVDLRRLRR